MPHTLKIDINADVGEGAVSDGGDGDRELLAFVSSANVACGFHAGGPYAIAAAIERCAELDVAIGAHPSYPDRSGFGRRPLDATPDEIFQDILYQIGAVDAFCRSAGVALRHVKPHGALYNRAAVNRTDADAVARAVFAFNPGLSLFAPPNSCLLRAAIELGLTAVPEVFADRAVDDDGSLASRRKPGSVLHDPEMIAGRAIRMVTEGTVVSINGAEIALRGETICLHGDSPGAGARAGALRHALVDAGIVIAPPWRSRVNGA